MKITFIGLSCFLIENQQGYRILVDPFSDDPKWTLGPIFPKEFDGKPFGTNLLLISETDADHATTPFEWQQNGPQVQLNSNPFPSLNLRGTVVHEYNGEPCIAWHYTVDGIRLAHFSDNAHPLTKDQLEELGHPDILFMPLPKVTWENQDAISIVRNNIEALKPKLVIWSHHIVPDDLPRSTDSGELREYFKNYFKENASTSNGYHGEESFIELCYVLENAMKLNSEYQGVTYEDPSLEIEAKEVFETNKTKTGLFLSMLASNEK